MKTISTATALKRKIWEICLEKQQSLAATTKEAMNNAQQSANEEKGSMEEKFESFREQLMRDRDMYARKLAEQISGIDTLRQIDINKKMTRVQPGAIVITDKQQFFVAFSLGEIKVGDGAYFAISVQSPLYQVMDGKSEGDVFEFRGIKQAIKAVY